MCSGVGERFQARKMISFYAPPSKCFGSSKISLMQSVRSESAVVLQPVQYRNEMLKPTLSSDPRQPLRLETEILIWTVRIGGV
jgi:hypothetical protein